MHYKIINKELGIATCSLADLTMKQVNQFLKQWESGSSIGSLILFYDKEADLIVLNSSNAKYHSWQPIVEAYIVADEEQREELKKMLSKRSVDVCRVLDNCLIERRYGRELSITKQQIVANEYLPVIKALYDAEVGCPMILALSAFSYGMVCGKRIERAKKAKQKA